MMSANKVTDDVATLAAIGVAVAIAASLAHEALGHGIGCFADGGTVTLLTFIVFRCDGAAVFSDGGGPVGALVVAAACLILIHRRRPAPTSGSIFTYALGVQTLLWVCAQLVREGIDGTDDWGHVAATLGWGWWWHVAAITIGVLGYFATISAAARLGMPLARGRPLRLLIPLLSSCVAAVGLGALWHSDRAGSAWDGFLSFGVSPLGYLWVIGVMATATPSEPLPPIQQNHRWLLVVVVVGTVYAVTIARGIGRLA